MAQGLAHRAWDNTLIFGPAPDSAAFADVQALTMDAATQRRLLIDEAEQQVAQSLSLAEDELQRRLMSVREFEAQHNALDLDRANHARWVWSGAAVDVIGGRWEQPIPPLTQEQFDARRAALSEGTGVGTGTGGPGGRGGVARSSSGGAGSSSRPARTTWPSSR